MMKKLVVFLSVSMIFSCKSGLDDISMNDNPYDKDYVGPKVVSIDSVVSKIIGITKYNYVYMKPTVQLYDKVHLYVDGVKIKTQSRASFGGVNQELITHSPVFAGNTFSYQVQLGQNDGVTDLSDPVTFVTP